MADKLPACRFCRGRRTCRFDGRKLAAEPGRAGRWMRRALATLGALFALATLAALAAAEKPTADRRSPIAEGRQPGPNLYRISSVAVYDGDTLTADIHLGFDVALSQQSVRLLGFDAWEMTRARRSVEIDETELEKGQKARDALRGFLAHGTPYLVPEGRGRDVYGRILARLVIVTDSGHVADVAGQMIRDGHDRGKAESGKRKAEPDP